MVVMNDLMRFYPNLNRMPRFAGQQVPRQQTPQMPQRQMAMGQPNMGAQGLFNAYMQNIFQQRYAPPPMQGGVQNMGGFYGFGAPKMNPIQAPQQPGIFQPPQGAGPGGQTWWDTGISTGA